VRNPRPCDSVAGDTPRRDFEQSLTGCRPMGGIAIPGLALLATSLFVGAAVSHESMSGGPVHPPGPPVIAPLLFLFDLGEADPRISFNSRRFSDFL
jgi:hypothetical protein